MSTFSMAAYDGLRKCQTHLDETKAIMKRFPQVISQLAQDSRIPKLKDASVQVGEVCANITSQLESLSETYATTEKDYREIGVLTKALSE